MISISLVDYIGVVDNGIGIILSLIIGEENYELMYWFNKENKYTIVIEDKFYIDFPKIDNILKYSENLMYHIDSNVLPPKSEIFKTFNL